MNFNLGPVSKAVAGGLAATVATNIGVGAMTMNEAQQAAMPWWGVLLCNVVYFGIGYGITYLAPANKPSS